MAIINGTTGDDLNLIGTNKDDTIHGLAGGDEINGLGGDDSLFGDEGFDLLYGGDGRDTLDGGAGLDELYGGEGNDVLSGGRDADELYGQVGNDKLRGGDGDDELEGGAGADILYGDAGDDDLSGDDDWGDGLDGADKLYGGEGNDQLDGDGGNDLLEGGAGYDSLVGGEGDDSLRGGTGYDSLHGGAGNDLLDGGTVLDPDEAAMYPDAYDEDHVAFWSAETGVTVNLKTGVAQDGEGGTDTLIDIESVEGTHYDDVLTGGNAENDSYEAFTGDGGNDRIDGGSGHDVAYYWADYQDDDRYQAIYADLAKGTIIDQYGDVDTVLNVEEVVATDLDDTLLGSAGNDVFVPRDGDDVINGRGGIDTVSYSGSRIARVWGWSDWEDSWEGYVNIRTTGIRADLTRGVIAELWGTDQVTSIENVTGSALDDDIRGDLNSNSLEGVGGADALRGGAGDDVLSGGRGNDYLAGGTGADRLYGGAGNDTLRGGGLGDIFVFGKDCDEDHILDFKTGADKIDVSAYDFASAADVLAKLVILSPGAAMLDLGADNYVIFDYVNTANTVLAAGDIII